MIKIENLEDIKKAFKKLDDIAQIQAIKKLSDGTYKRALNYISSNHFITGRLFKSIFREKIDEKSFKIGTYLDKAPYALFVHFGTKAHIIKPKDKTFLRWVKNDKFIFAKKARHPGYKGDEFLIKIVNDEMKIFKRWLDKKVGEL